MRAAQRATIPGMVRPARVPDALRGRVFTTADAAAAGVTSSMLRGNHFVQVHRGVWRLAETELTFALGVHAARLALPAHAALSHVSALRWMGVAVGRPFPLHYSVHGSAQTRAGTVLHRREGRLHPRDVRGIPTLGPDRSFVDSATLLGLRDLVRAGDALVRAGLTTTETLVDYAIRSHLDGVIRAREAALLVRDRVDSPRETDVRLLLTCAGLPEPEVNVDVHADDGTWLAKGDLVLRRWRIVVEHDGWHHERDADQRQNDHFRRERLEAAGWTLIVVTQADFEQATSIVVRVYQTLVRRGYRGPPPELGRTWHRITRNL
jgi:hypothetical protein